MVFNKLKTILLDDDGVLLQGEKGHLQLVEFFQVLRENEINWALLTNNNTLHTDTYVEKLNKFGIPATGESVYSSATASAAYIKQKYWDAAQLHVVDMPGLTSTLSDAGFQITSGEQIPDSTPQAVVAGMDREITHEKIKVAMRKIIAGAEFIATNTDGSFPSSDGFNPGTGMVIGPLQATTATNPTVINWQTSSCNIQIGNGSSNKSQSQDDSNGR